MQGKLQVLCICCSLAQGPGADHGRCCRALSKGLELQPQHYLDYIMLLIPPANLRASMTKDSWKPVPAAGTEGPWPSQGYMKSGGLSPFHCPGRENDAFSSSMLFYPAPQISGTWTFKYMATPSLVLLASEASHMSGTSVTTTCRFRGQEQSGRNSATGNQGKGAKKQDSN